MRALIWSVFGMIAIGIVGCTHAVDNAKVLRFGDEITRSQSQDSPYRASVAQTKHILKLSNEKLDGKLYRLISEKYDG